MTIRVLLADDHKIFREGLRSILELEDDIEIVAEASDGHEAVARATECHPDIVLMDLSMPGLSGVDACHDIRDALPETGVVMFTAAGDERSVTASILAGAQGYLVKT